MIYHNKIQVCHELLSLDFSAFQPPTTLISTRACGISLQQQPHSLPNLSISESPGTAWHRIYMLIFMARSDSGDCFCNSASATADGELRHKTGYSRNPLINPGHCQLGLILQRVLDELGVGEWRFLLDFLRYGTCFRLCTLRLLLLLAIVFPVRPRTGRRRRSGRRAPVRHFRGQMRQFVQLEVEEPRQVLVLDVLCKGENWKLPERSFIYRLIGGFVNK